MTARHRSHDKDWTTMNTLSPQHTFHSIRTHNSKPIHTGHGKNTGSEKIWLILQKQHIVLISTDQIMLL